MKIPFPESLTMVASSFQSCPNLGSASCQGKQEVQWKLRLFSKETLTSKQSPCFLYCSQFGILIFFLFYLKFFALSISGIFQSRYHIMWFENEIVKNKERESPDIFGNNVFASLPIVKKKEMKIPDIFGNKVFAYC